MWKPSLAPLQPPVAREPTASPAVTPIRPQPPVKVQLQALIGRSISIKGEITGSEPLHIEGQFEGSIHLGDSVLHIGQNATVISKVSARELVVRGTLQGNSTLADRLEIRSGGSLIGNVTAKRISIEDGAYFKGSIDMRRPAEKTNGNGAAESAEEKATAAASSE